MFFRGNKKTKGRSPGSYPYEREDLKRVDWCLSNNISIAVTPGEYNDDWLLELRINGKTHIDPKVYTGEEAIKKMYEYYKYYYDKYRN